MGNKLIVVTGGLGFIGTNLILSLLENNQDEIIICDNRVTPKHHIFSKIKIIESEKLLEFLLKNKNYLKAIIHLGAITDTTERNIELILKNNYYFSLELWNFCSRFNIKFIYASSAATYGDGNLGFDDNLKLSNLSKLYPLNPYGWSKHLYDIKVTRSSLEEKLSPKCWAGLKFFNVYGPNEDHKGAQSSVAYQMIKQIKSGQPITLFRSHNNEYKDGEQLRDFIYVEDCVSVINWFLNRNEFTGIYNVGSGKARNFLDLASATCQFMDVDLKINWIDTPENVREQYQYFTQANMDKLYQIGYNEDFYTLEKGIEKYTKIYTG